MFATGVSSRKRDKSVCINGSTSYTSFQASCLGNSLSPATATAAASSFLLPASHRKVHKWSYSYCSDTSIKRGEYSEELSGRRRRSNGWRLVRTHPKARASGFTCSRVPRASSHSSPKATWSDIHFCLPALSCLDRELSLA